MSYDNEVMSMVLDSKVLGGSKVAGSVCCVEAAMQEMRAPLSCCLMFLNIRVEVWLDAGQYG